VNIKNKQWVLVLCVLVCVQGMRAAAEFSNESTPLLSQRDRQDGIVQDREEAQRLNGFEFIRVMNTPKKLWGRSLQVAHLEIKGDVLKTLYANRKFSEIDLSSGKIIRSGKVKVSAPYFHKMDSPVGSWWVDEKIVNWKASSARWYVQTDEVSGAVTRMDARGNKVGDGYFFHANLFGDKDHPRTKIKLFRKRINESACHGS
jgi:hypothetical protein